MATSLEFMAEVPRNFFFVIKLDLDIQCKLKDSPTLFYCFVPSSRTSTKRSFHIWIAITKQPQYTELRQQFIYIFSFCFTSLRDFVRRQFLVRFTL